MAESLVVPLLLVALVTNALAAGFFYAFVCAVMPGLARTDDRTFVTSMVAINAAVQNPLFALGFFGSFVFSGAALVASIVSGATGTGVPTAIALALFVVQYVITFSSNIPLNLRLDRDARGADAPARRAFEGPWVRSNVVRMLVTAGSVLSLGAALLAAA